MRESERSKRGFFFCLFQRKRERERKKGEKEKRKVSKGKKESHLKDISTPPLQPPPPSHRRDIMPIHADHPRKFPLFLPPGQDIHQARFSRSRGTHDGEKLAWGHVAAHSLEDLIFLSFSGRGDGVGDVLEGQGEWRGGKVGSGGKGGEGDVVVVILHSFFLSSLFSFLSSLNFERYL
jgi:hypothetical protein